MSSQKSHTPKPAKGQTGAQTRKERLAQALRDNLKRRKQAPKAPGDGDESSTDDSNARD